jgi:hypothetical protein
MKKLFILGFSLCFPLFYSHAQNIPEEDKKDITRENLTLRPNSRDYNIVRKGNNHQRLVQFRSQAMMRNKQALLNRQIAMERRRQHLQQQMMRKQNLRQRMIRERGKHH